ncbi:NfeD family protein [Haematomicrobium sanguinis]|uniref:NfeD family protein n=1 Tax=Haematomicrobium sanguinis TaxID=479106 RepID=UPI0004786E1B|nr:NfeD family protein [Haematomicrobium sanguinis]
MLDWLVQNGWALWLVLVLVLAGVEMLTLDLIFIMMSVGALSGLIVSLFGVPFPLQFVVAAVVSLVMIFVVRPIALRQMHKNDPELRTNADRLIGESALTIEPVDSVTGTVKIEGDTWSARSEDGTAISVGEKVLVTRIDGAIAIVSTRPATTTEFGK